MTLAEKTIRIGSDPECDLCIRDQAVAAIHAIMYLSEGMLCIELLEGNVATLNGFEVEGRYWLHQYDELFLGDVRLDLSAIYKSLCEEQEKVEGVFFQDDSDAVEVKRNYWVIILFSFISIGVIALLASSILGYHKQKKAQMELLKKQDSVIQASKNELDSINQLLEQFEY